MDRQWTDKRTDDLADRVDRFEGNVDKRFDKVEAKMKTNSEKLEAKVETTNRTLWAGIFVAVLVKLLFS